MFAELRARAWQIGTFAASAVALSLAVALGVTTIQKNRLAREVERKNAEIIRVKADLGQCRANTQTLEKAIENSNAEIQRVAQAGADKLRVAEDAVAAAKSGTARVNARINLLMKTPALGATQCERVEEIDRAVQEAFR